MLIGASLSIRQSLNILREKSNITLFSIAGMLLLIGALLCIIIVGFIIIWIAVLLLIITSFQIKPQEPNTHNPTPISHEP
ncbi:MAG: DUF996 domain-containing protein [Nitrososphaerota archaeon]|nr:DUF996 domain-containing protein [Nitrososphaerota archaeon]